MKGGCNEDDNLEGYRLEQVCPSMTAGRATHYIWARPAFFC